MHPRSTYFFYSPRPSSQLYCISSSSCDSAAQSKSYRSGSGHRRRLSPCLSSVAHPQISTVHPHLAKDGWVRINVADEVKRKWEGMERNSLTAFSLSLSPLFCFLHNVDALQKMRRWKGLFCFLHNVDVLQKMRKWKGRDLAEFCVSTKKEVEMPGWASLGILKSIRPKICGQELNLAEGPNYCTYENLNFYFYKNFKNIF